MSTLQGFEKRCVRALFLLGVAFTATLLSPALHAEGSSHHGTHSSKPTNPSRDQTRDQKQEHSSSQENRPCNKCNSSLTYYLYISDFAQSFIKIPTSNVFDDSSTISSKFLAGRAPIYDEHGKKFGTCSASFLCMKNDDGLYTDISNYISADNGLIVTWFTPTTLLNLKADSVVNSMVTECIVMASTKVGFNPFYGQEFNLIVSSDDGKIYFKFTKI